jgi:hypothetical protein
MVLDNVLAFKICAAVYGKAWTGSAQAEISKSIDSAEILQRVSASLMAAAAKSACFK